MAPVIFIKFSMQGASGDQSSHDSILEKLSKEYRARLGRPTN